MSHRQALQHTPSAVKRRETEIPFGIRAIQSGIQVDGVWISGSNTVANSRAPSVVVNTDSSDKSNSSETNHGPNGNARLERPQPAHRQSTQDRSTNASVDLANGHGHSLQVERPGRLSTEYVPRGRPTYQPRRASGLRYSNIDENSDALNALEGRRNGTAAGADVSSGMRNFVGRIRRDQPDSQRSESIELSLMPPVPGYLRREQHYNASSNASSASSSGDEQQHAPRRNPLTTITSSGFYESGSLSRNQQNPVSRGQRDIADALAYHRRSQGAEEGQLIPRIRLSHDAAGPTSDGPIEYSHRNQSPYQLEETNDPFLTPLATPMLGTSAFGSPMDSPIKATYESHAEEPPTFGSFVNANPPLNDNSASPTDCEETSPISQQGALPLQYSDGNRQQRQSQVVRKVNSGFEILRPGSFSQPRNQQPGDRNRDLERGYDLVDNTRQLERPPKKLQRKRADSKESRFKEQV